MDDNNGHKSYFDFSAPEDGNVLRSYSIGAAKIVLSIDSLGKVKISSVRVPQSKRKNGFARRAISKLIEQSDFEGVDLYLDASPLDSKTNLNKLIGFYESLGFVKTGKTINFLGEPEMKRIANNSLSSQPSLSNEGMKEFSEWFGSSEAINEDGSPIIFYHGTNSDFDSFDESRRGSVWNDTASTDCQRNIEVAAKKPSQDIVSNGVFIVDGHPIYELVSKDGNCQILSDLTPDAIISAMDETYPVLSGGVSKLLKRGELNQSNSLVIVTGTENEVLERVAQITGKDSKLFASILIDRQDGLVGIHDTAKNVTFLMGHELSPKTAVKLLLREALRIDHSPTIDKTAFDLVLDRKHLHETARKVIDAAIKKMVNENLGEDFSAAAPYILEAALIEIRSCGISRFEDGYEARVGRILGEDLGRFVRESVEALKQFWSKMGVVQGSAITVDDLLYYSVSHGHEHYSKGALDHMPADWPDNSKNIAREFLAKGYSILDFATTKKGKEQRIYLDGLNTIVIHKGVVEFTRSESASAPSHENKAIFEKLQNSGNKPQKHELKIKPVL